MRVLLLIIVSKFLFISCVGDNIPTYEVRNNKGKYDINTGSGENFDTQFERLNTSLKSIDIKVKDLQKVNTKDNKSDFLDTDSIDDYFELVKNLKLLNKQIEINWIYYLQEVLDRYDKNKTKIDSITDSKKFKDKKTANVFKEKILKLEEKSQNLKNEIQEYNLLDSKKEFDDRESKINSMNFEYKVLINQNKIITKILDQFKKRDGEEYSEQLKKISKTEIDNLLKDIKNCKESYEITKNDIKASEKQKSTKEDLYALSLKKGLEKIKEYIQF